MQFEQLTSYDNEFYYQEELVDDFCLSSRQQHHQQCSPCDEEAAHDMIDDFLDMAEHDTCASESFDDSPVRAPLKRLRKKSELSQKKSHLSKKMNTKSQRAFHVSPDYYCSQSECGSKSILRIRGVNYVPSQKQLRWRDFALNQDLNSYSDEMDDHHQTELNVELDPELEECVEILLEESLQTEEDEEESLPKQTKRRPLQIQDEDDEITQSPHKSKRVKLSDDDTNQKEDIFSQILKAEDTKLQMDTLAWECSKIGSSSLVELPHLNNVMFKDFQSTFDLAAENSDETTTQADSESEFGDFLFVEDASLVAQRGSLVPVGI